MSTSTRWSASSDRPVAASRRCCAASTRWSRSRAARSASTASGRPRGRRQRAAPGRRHRVPELQPVPAHERARQRDARPREGAESAAAEAVDRAHGAARSDRALGEGRASTPTGSPAASSNESRSCARSRCSPRSCCSTRSPSALDPELVAEKCSRSSASSREGMTMLIATHEMGFARDVASKVVFLYEGQIEEEGPPRSRSSAIRTASARARSSAASSKPSGCTGREDHQPSSSTNCEIVDHGHGPVDGQRRSTGSCGFAGVPAGQTEGGSTRPWSRGSRRGRTAPSTAERARPNAVEQLVRPRPVRTRRSPSCKERGARLASELRNPFAPSPRTRLTPATGRPRVRRPCRRPRR